MEFNASYIVNENGEKKYAIIPIDKWLEIQKLIRKYEILEGIQKGYLEAKGSLKNGENLSTLDEVLDEC
ncbi:MAG: hypothetical protein H7A25_23910 [Leptospiraceae bacterium]|nr:hypothetical protein [Leptospiraceae bacterium]